MLEFQFLDFPFHFVMKEDFIEQILIIKRRIAAICLFFALKKNETMLIGSRRAYNKENAVSKIMSILHKNPARVLFLLCEFS